MSFSERTPQVMKGAIVGLDPLNPLASIVVFQYNPDTLTRTLQAQAAGGQGGSGRSEALRLNGAPIETLKLDVEIDATDQLERNDPLTEVLGIYPQLSALEMLIYPKSALVIANTILLAAGTMEVIPASAPLTLFIWGPKRILPVRLTEFSIVEESYDAQLNPVRAKVSLGLRVLSYNDLPLTDPGYALFLAHQVVKEAMAVIGSVGNVTGSVSASFSVA
ncbi:MAG TPA: hypothetical protein VGM91_23220 [Conexibacter sp.]|jgi:hypothetical protein